MTISYEDINIDDQNVKVKSLSELEKECDKVEKKVKSMQKTPRGPVYKGLLKEMWDLYHQINVKLRS